MAGARIHPARAYQNARRRTRKKLQTSAPGRLAPGPRTHCCPTTPAGFAGASHTAAYGLIMATFPAVRIEGGLLGPDVLDQLLAAELPGQKPADFRLEGRRNLTDEVAAIFADARALWQVFQHRLQRLSAEDLATSVTRDAWEIPFLGLLGYEPRYNPRAFEVDDLTFAISHRAGESEDTPPVHIVGARQELGRVAVSGRPRLAPHSLVQEYLNRTEHLWGIVTNGPTLRLLRNSTFIRRQAYVEFDLTAIF